MIDRSVFVHYRTEQAKAFRRIHGDRGGCRYSYIVRYKRHWWNRWRYIIDDRHNVPMLFPDTGAAIKAINEL